MSLKKFLYVYLIFFSIILLIIILRVKPHPDGEWDDYSLVTASLINDYNVGIDEQDVIFAKKFFGALSKAYEDGYALSGYNTRNGDEMSWYFLTYSAACVPLALILSVLGSDPSYCFYLTNFIIFILALYLCIKEYSGTDKRKLILILMLSINPIIFYMTWISAEVFIYALLVMAILSWHERKYIKTSVLLSVASTLNPVILAAAFFVTIDFLYDIIKKYNSKTLKEVFESFIGEAKQIGFYGGGYLIALIPFIYNYYEIGHINLTAASFATDEPKIMIVKRFIAYLLDLNFGFLPYYNLFFTFSIVLFILAVVRRKWKYIGMMLAFYGIIAGYSIMLHINSGMSGIARYNAWSSVIMIFSVISYMDSLITHRLARIVSLISIAVSLIINLFILCIYGPIGANKTSHIRMTPIASFVLDYFPTLYSPLHSTFNSRVTHIDGGYTYKLPIVYKDHEENIRKILIDPSSINTLKAVCFGETNEDQEWLNQKLSNVTKEEYISVPTNRNLKSANQLDLNQSIYFAGDKRNSEMYVDKGISGNEVMFAWTDDKELILSFMIKKADLDYILDCSIFGVYNGTQSVKVKENNAIIYQDTLYGKSDLKIPLTPSETGYVKLYFEFDKAVSPLELGVGADNRILALQLESATLLGK